MFERLASTVFFGLAANIDNLTIGGAYGLQGRRISLIQNLLIASITTLITLAAMAFGRQIRDMLPPRLTDVLGAILLLAVAAWNVCWDRIQRSKRPALRAPPPIQPRSAGFGEILLLAGSLSINNIGLAIPGGIGGLRYVAAACAIFGFSVLMLALGQAAGGAFVRVGSLPKVLRSPMSGNAILALAGVLMLAGY